MTAIQGISSMATRALLATLAAAYAQQAPGSAVNIESVGGVDAARRVQAGEVFDLVFLAADAIDRLMATGHVAGGRVDLVRSDVAVAVREGAPRPDLRSEDAVRRAVLAAPRIGYSTGPSGSALLRLFERWGIAAELTPRLVQAPPGVPVGALLARGEVDLGLQQYSELMDVPGITLAGRLPASIAITTTFSAGVCAASTRADEARRVLDFMASPATAELKRRHGMQPA